MILAIDVLSARNRLIEEHMAMVEPIARNIGRRLPPCFDLADLIDAGMQGLMRAAKSYDPAAHADMPFKSWARKIISGEILENVRRRHWTEQTAPHVQDVMEPRSAPRVDADIDRERMKRVLAEAVSWLPRREQLVLQLLFVERCKLREVGSILHLSPSRISQIRNRALAALRPRLAMAGVRGVSLAA